jgi:hypothetical protein
MASISPAERLRRELESTLDGVGEEVDPVEALENRAAASALLLTLGTSGAALPKLSITLSVSIRMGLADACL